jgi:hypothetical protein
MVQSSITALIAEMRQEPAPFAALHEFDYESL